MVREKKHKGKKQPGRGLGQKEKKFLHVKEFSQGKPNELSLNVLEQKAANLEEQPSRFKLWRSRRNESNDSPFMHHFISKKETTVVLMPLPLRMLFKRNLNQPQRRMLLIQLQLFLGRNLKRKLKIDRDVVNDTVVLVLL